MSTYYYINDTDDNIKNFTINGNNNEEFYINNNNIIKHFDINNNIKNYNESGNNIEKFTADNKIKIIEHFDIGKEAAKLLKPLGNSVKGLFDGLKKSMDNILSEAMKGLKVAESGLKSVGNTILDTIIGPFKWIKDFFTSSWDAIVILFKWFLISVTIPLLLPLIIVIGQLLFQLITGIVPAVLKAL